MPQFSRQTLVSVSADDAGVTATPWIPMNQYSQPFNVGFGVLVSGNEDYQVQHTFDDIFDTSITPVTFVHEDASAFSADIDGNYAFPVAAIRLSRTSAGTSGRASAMFWVRQAGL